MHAGRRERAEAIFLRPRSDPSRRERPPCRRPARDRAFQGEDVVPPVAPGAWMNATTRARRVIARLFLAAGLASWVFLIIAG